MTKMRYVCALWGLLFVAATHATQYGWTGAGDGAVWGDSNNWGGVSFPQSGDSAVFGNGDSPTINLGTNRTIAAMTVASGNGATSVVGFDNGGTNRALTLTAALTIGSTPDLNANAAYGTLDIGADTSLDLDGPLFIGVGRRMYCTLAVNGGVCTVGSAGGPVSVDIGHKTSTYTANPTRGYLDVNGGAFTVVANTFSLGTYSHPSSGTAQESAGVMTVRAGTVDVRAEVMRIGADLSSLFGAQTRGTLDTTASLDPMAFRVGSLTVGRGEDPSRTVSGRVSFGNPSNANLQVFAVTNALAVGTTRSGNGRIQVNAGLLRLGTNERRIDAVIGQHGSSLGGTAVGVIDVGVHGRLEAYLGTMQLGWNFNSGGNALGTLDLTSQPLGSESCVLDANLVTVGYDGDGPTRSGTLLLGEGTCRLGQLIAGRSSGGTANIDLNGTVVRTTSVTLNSGADVDVVISWDEAGLDLTDESATLSVLGTGNLTLTFEDPDPLFRGIYWGLRWAGDHTSELQALWGNGLTVVTNTSAQHEIEILEYAGHTYIGFIAHPLTGAVLKVR